MKLEVAIVQILSGLYELHCNHGFVHGNITPSSIQFDGSRYRLNHWCLNTLTENGALLDSDTLFPDDIRFLAPERITSISKAPGRKSDIWSLAITFLHLMFPDKINLPANPSDLARLDSCDQVLKRLQVPLENLSTEWLSYFQLSLEPIPKNRSSIAKLLEVFKVNPPKLHLNMLETLFRHDKLSLNLDNPRKAMNIREAYYLFSLACPGMKDGPDKLGSNQRKVPPIYSIPSSVALNPALSASTSKSSSASSPSSPDMVTINCSFIPSRIHKISTDLFGERLSQIDPNLFFPLIVFDPESDSDKERSSSSQLPLVIRENDFAYQCERTMLFKALTEGVPYIRGSLIEAAQVDINPFYRSLVWGSILNVKWSDLVVYEEIDKITATSTDRQISVDIPRCHQYNDLLASPKGHLKLARVLKAWLARNESRGMVYWQGLDSLASPFVIVNFDNEPLALACFDAFINKYLKGFFDKDNSPTIQEYLALFSHLVAFHDPALFNHLDTLGFNPELYAIPWFLTMFTHVLPLHKSIHVWDTLLLGNEGFPLCIGFSILLQLRSQLLDFSFNDCILIFSDLPEVNIDKLVKDSIRIFKATPKSALQREWV